MPDEILLNEAAYAVWQTVKDRGPIELGEVVRLTGIDQAQVSAAATDAARSGYFEIIERERDELVIDNAGVAFLQQSPPERRAIVWLNSKGGSVPINDFIQSAKALGVAPNEVLKWGVARGWIERVQKQNQGVSLVVTDAGRVALDKRDDDERAIEQAIHNDRRIFLDVLDERNIDSRRVHLLLSKRPEVAKIKRRNERSLELTLLGRKEFEHARKVIERNSLTPEDLESGAWRAIKLRPYDVTLAAKDVYPAKIHPLRKIIEQTRRAFLEMGFAEVVSPMIESAFWNFDALFQPQDHPARDMQDTFYMKDPAEAPLPDSDVVELVRRTHEDGWTTGSEGWGYQWSPERSKQVVLRTHTTAATIRALAAHPNPPGKFFCVGWTYRNETISFKHLPVFHQVDGIIVDEEANLASLMGTLQEFYSKMGFGRVKFKPAFYPYTEPSVDVVVYMEARKKWLEMGGAGIFRPEVTLPLGCNYPVLAWGLGIERLAMLRFGFSDIRDLYRASLDALEEVPLCR
jgi:phenylalanyl-tRNA synthetase alpha chain